MQPGQMDRRAALQKRSIAADGFGNERGGFATVTTVWAQLRVPKPGETRDGAERSAEEAELRYRRQVATAVIAAGDRAVIDGRAWRLLGDPVESFPRSGVMVARLQREG